MNIASIIKAGRDEANGLLATVENIFVPALKAKVTPALKAFGVTDTQVTAAETAVQNAATVVANTTGDQKRSTAITQIKDLFSELEPYVINLLIDSAFGYLRAAGKV